MFSSTENQLFGFMSFVSVILLLLPSPWHWRVRNTGTLMMIGWGAIGILNVGINALAFNKNLNLKSVVACDISAIIDRIWQFGFVASTLCVLRRLEQIASTRQARWTDKDVRHRLIFDLCFGIGIPVLQIPLFFVIQHHRLNVIENIGCNAPIYHSIPAIFLFYIWRLLLSTACLIYAVLILRWFIIRRRQFAAVLQSSNSGLTISKYNRLMGMAVAEILLMFSLQVFSLVKIIKNTKLLPYSSWNKVHEGFGAVVFYPISLFDDSRLITFNIARWSTISIGFIFFFFFGLSEDARSQYKQWCRAIYKIVSQPFQRFRRRQDTPKNPELQFQSEDVEKGWNVANPTYAGGTFVHSAGSDTTEFQIRGDFDKSVEDNQDQGVFISVTKFVV